MLFRLREIEELFFYSGFLPHQKCGFAHLIFCNGSFACSRSFGVGFEGMTAWGVEIASPTARNDTENLSAIDYLNWY